MYRQNEELVRKAKNYGLNISKISENALKEMIARIERPITQNKPENYSINHQNINLVDGDKI